MTFQAISPPLPLTAIAFQGPDAKSFLQGQFTNDLGQLSPLTSSGTGGAAPIQLNGYCSPKGRLLALGWLFQADADRYLWLVPTELAAGLQKRLRMFVLRAKVVVDLLTEEVRGVWLTEPLDHPAQGEVQAHGPDLLLLRHTAGRGFLLGAPAPVTPAAHAVSAGTTSTGTTSTERSLQDWWSAEAEAGLPWIWSSSQEAFVPQMVNLDLIGGVSFTKGCYPGQEVVARSQYLGKLHRRMFGVSLDLSSLGADLPAGHALVFVDQPDAPVGQLVTPLSARSPQLPMPTGTSAPSPALIECTLDAWALLRQGAHLHPEGQPSLRLTPSELPYTVPTEVQQPNRPKL